MNCIRFVIVLDSCCISIGLVLIKDRPVSSFWVFRFRVLGASFSRFRGLRFRVLGASFSSFGCFVFEIWVLRASVFVFECFVFETTYGLHEFCNCRFHVLGSGSSIFHESWNCLCDLFTGKSVVSRRWSSFSQDKVSSLVPEQVQLSPSDDGCPQHVFRRSFV